MRALPSSRWLALALLLGCRDEAPNPAPPAAEESVASAEASAATLHVLPEDSVITKHETAGRELSAREVVELRAQRTEGFALSAEQLAQLAEYDRVLERIMTEAEAEGWEPDLERPSIVTRDYELWVLHGRRYRVTDRDGRVLADDVGETRIRADFPYLHALLHPEHAQFYDAVDY